MTRRSRKLSRASTMQIFEGLFKPLEKFLNSVTTHVTSAREFCKILQNWGAGAEGREVFSQCNDFANARQYVIATPRKLS